MSVKAFLGKTVEEQERRSCGWVSAWHLVLLCCPCPSSVAISVQCPSVSVSALNYPCMHLLLVVMTHVGANDL